VPFSVNAAIAEIDAVLMRYEDVFSKHKSRGEFGTYEYVGGPDEVRSEITTVLRQTIARLAPVPNYGKEAIERYNSAFDCPIRVLAGVLKALRDDYASGRLLSIQERIHSDVFSDFLETAEYLIGDEGLKDPAAVLAGGVLEQHLRKLCDKNGIAIPPKPKLDTMNADLAKQGVYGKNDQKQVTAWAAIRNDAAHAQYSNYTAEQVKLMIAWVRDFIGRNPA